MNCYLDYSIGVVLLIIGWISVEIKESEHEQAFGVFFKRLSLFVYEDLSLELFFMLWYLNIQAVINIWPVQ